MSRPDDSFFRRVMLRPRLLDVPGQPPDPRDQEYSNALQQMIIETNDAIRSVQDGMWVSVRDYDHLAGTGRGITDDTLAIQQAIDAVGENGGGSVFIPAGSYFVSELTVRHDNVHIRGEGALATTLFATGNNDDIITMGGIGLGVPSVVDCGVRDLSTSHENVSPTGSATGIQGILGQRLDIYNCTVLGADLAFQFRGCERCFIANCRDLLTSPFPGAGCSITNQGVTVSQDLVVSKNDFTSYVITSTPFTNIFVRDNNPIALPTVTINGVDQVITNVFVMQAPHRFMQVTTAGAGPNNVARIQPTFDQDLRTFIVLPTGTTVLTFTDNGGAPVGGPNLHLNGNFVSTANAEKDTLTLYCDGTDWIEVARSVN